MRRSVRLVLLASYYYALFLGVLPFHYDFPTERLRSTSLFKIYTATANIFLVAVIPLLQITRNAWTTKRKSDALQGAIYSVTGFVRIVAVLITLLLNWTKRREFIASLNEFQRLDRDYFCKLSVRHDHQRSFEHGVLRKFTAVLLADLGCWAYLLDVLRYDLDWRLFVLSCWVVLLFTVMSTLMNQYYFLVKYVNLHFAVLNDELEHILLASRAIEKSRRDGAAYTAQCRQLTKRLDELVWAHYRLQQLNNRITNIMSIHGACVLLNLYLNNIASMYFTYSLIRHDAARFGLSDRGLFVCIFTATVYYFDHKVFLGVLFELLETSSATPALLKQQIPLSMLDARFERSLEYFCLHIVGNPLEMDLMGLFKFNKRFVFSVFGSAVLSAIVLMQYDYQNY